MVVASLGGDSQYINYSERISLIQHAAREWGSKLAIVGNPWPERRGFDNTKDGFAAGMDASLLLLPHKAVYPKMEELVQHMKEGLDCGPSIITNKSWGSRDHKIP